MDGVIDGLFVGCNVPNIGVNVGVFDDGIVDCEVWFLGDIVEYLVGVVAVLDGVVVGYLVRVLHEVTLSNRWIICWIIYW